MGIEPRPAAAVMQSAVGAEIQIDGRTYVNFGGSSYLGMASNPEVLAAGMAALREWGSGTPIPRDHGVATAAHLAVESEAAEFFGSPAALFLANGYLLGLVALGALTDRADVIFFDESTHYSMREAIAASGLESHAYRHLDPDDLKVELSKHLHAAQKPWVISDGLYSSLGEIAPLDDIARVLSPYGGRLLIDESHSFGVLGPTGRGAIEHHQVRVPALIGGSLGKAFGTSGGIIPASVDEVRAFRSTRAGRGATAGLPAAAAMCAASLRYVRHHPQRLHRLRANIGYLKGGLRALGLDIPNTLAPVASFTPASGKSMGTLKAELMSEGIFVYHSTYIGAGAAGVIRCGIFADHTTEHMDRLLDALRRLL